MSDAVTVQCSRGKTWVLEFLWTPKTLQNIVSEKVNPLLVLARPTAAQSGRDFKVFVVPQAVPVVYPQHALFLCLVCKGGLGLFQVASMLMSGSRAEYYTRDDQC